MIISYIRWKDACQKEAIDSPEPKPEFCILTEVGFLLAENDDVVLIGMEQEEDENGLVPSRWRLNILKSNIIERRDVDVYKAFKISKPKKGKHV